MATELKEHEITKLFPCSIPISEMMKLKIDNESLYSITIPKATVEIGNIIKKYYTITDTSSIIDATSGVGGDTISYSKLFNKVISIEKNKDRYEFLLHNLQIYNISNVVSYNDTFLNLLDLDADIVYMDPPWSGRSYKDVENLTLTLDAIPIEQICKDIISKKNKPNLIVIKLPHNYDFNNFKKYDIVFNIHKLYKFSIIVICL